MSRLREIMRDKRVAGALAVVALLLVGSRLLPLRGKETRTDRPANKSAGEHREGMPAEVSAPPPAAQHTPDSPRSVDRTEPEVAWSWERNPFLPAGSAVPEGGGSGIAAGPTDPGGGKGMPDDLRGTVVAGRVGMAIFGSRLVQVGERIGGWTVERVEPYRIAVRRGGETRVVEMFKPAMSGAERRGGKQ
jgi:hypothetical protein